MGVGVTYFELGWKVFSTPRVRPSMLSGASAEASVVRVLSVDQDCFTTKPEKETRPKISSVCQE